MTRQPHGITAWHVRNVAAGWIFLHTGIGFAQAPPPAAPRPLSEAALLHRMDRLLYDLDRAVTRPGADSAVEVKKRDLPVLADGRVNVEIFNTRGPKPLDPAIVARVGGWVDATWQNGVSAWVPPEQLVNLARLLPPYYFLEQPNVPVEDAVAGQGPNVTNSRFYRDFMPMQFRGQGIVVVVIDTGFRGLTAARTNGDAPNLVDSRDFSGSGLEAGTNTHGTRVIESLYDHAPRAKYFAAKVVNSTHLGKAVDFSLLAPRAHVISHSLSWFNTGWADDTGKPSAAARKAAQGGALFFTSAGNFAQKHWQGAFADANGNKWHEWGPGDEALDITVPKMTKVTFRLSWDTTSGIQIPIFFRTNYDLHLYKWNPGTRRYNFVKKSTNAGTRFETITYTTGAARETLGVYVEHIRGPRNDLEFFSTRNLDEHRVARSSTASPTNTNHLYVVSVGAVRHNNYGKPVPPRPDNRAQPYSSRGPTNGLVSPPRKRLIVPDLCGPDSTSDFTGPGPFRGTSDATPNAAGVTAVAWTVNPNAKAGLVRRIITTYAGIHRDWGAQGKDNLHGEGGVFLPAVVDCNMNNIPDALEFLQANCIDCNTNGHPDTCDIDGDTSTDVNTNAFPDECERDCNTNGLIDQRDEIQFGLLNDCDVNGIADLCQIAAGTAADCNTNGVLDLCDIEHGTAADCNGNGILDECDLAGGTGQDCDTNGTLDICEITVSPLVDCDGNGVPDVCDPAEGDCNTNDVADTCEDCNTNGLADDCDIADLLSDDCNTNGLPDECEDCNTNGLADACEVADGIAFDCNTSGLLDICEGANFVHDCDSNGIPDICESPSDDCNTNGIRDHCETFDDVNTNDIPDDCEDCNTNGTVDGLEPGFADCDGNGRADFCDIADASAADCNTNGIVDGCEAFVDCNQNGILDECDLGAGTAADCNSNGILDACDVDGGTSADCDLDGLLNDCEECGDLNTNGEVDGDDFTILLLAFGHEEGESQFDPAADLNANGIVDFLDYQIWLCCFRNSTGDAHAPPPPPGNAGDMNLDGLVDGDDIQRFVEVLFDPSDATFVEFLLADFTRDGVIDEQDVAAFVDRLLE